MNHLARQEHLPVGPTMLKDFPEVEEFMRLDKRSETIIKYKYQMFKEENFIEVDSSFFNIFSLKLLIGNK